VQVRNGKIIKKTQSIGKANVLGTEGEALAAKWLADKGYTLIHQNRGYSYYEVDIISFLGNVLHFIEVKTRRSKKFGEPEESIDNKKIMNLMKTGEAFQYQFPSGSGRNMMYCQLPLNQTGQLTIFLLKTFIYN
jgi:putative endonuclease